MLRLFSLRGLPFTGSDGEEKAELSFVELESLRSELHNLGEREAHWKARLENIDEILRCARFSGYLYIRSRWEALPGEPPPIDDSEVDDWLPRFVVLLGPCLFFYQLSTGPLPSIEREDAETRHCFYVLTRYGLRFECAGVSKIQVDSWLAALRIDRKSASDETVSNDQSCNNITSTTPNCT